MYDDLIEKHHNQPYGHKKPVLQLGLNDVLVKEWDSISTIDKSVEFKNSRKYIRLCCQKKKEKFKNYKWKFKK